MERVGINLIMVEDYAAEDHFNRPTWIVCIGKWCDRTLGNPERGGDQISAAEAQNSFRP